MEALIAFAVSPILEEIVFRWGLHDWLKSRLAYRLIGLTAANFITALVFGLCHAILRHEPAGLATALPALVFGFIYERSGRLWAPIASHALANILYICVIVPTLE